MAKLTHRIVNLHLFNVPDKTSVIEKSNSRISCNAVSLILFQSLFSLTAYH